ncbi:GNAT family N-acetyltransferase [Candidatus Dojkabacteria bacterium]|nr:GNAT family N-acetyltransferase [Candidatus Dojkabacteria bacterium]
MIKISKATRKDDLNKEWKEFSHLKYGQGANWIEKIYRFKAVEDGKILGTIEGKYEPGVIYISALMVTENARGKGIGRMLIEKTEKWGKTLGAHRTWLSTGANWSNRSFYEKLGFKVIANFSDFYFHKDFVIYSRLIK